MTTHHPVTLKPMASFSEFSLFQQTRPLVLEMSRTSLQPLGPQNAVLSLPFLICEIQILGRCLSPYAGGDLTRPNGQAGGWRYSPFHHALLLLPARLSQPWPAPSWRQQPAIEDAKQRKIFLKLQHLAPWQPPPVGGPGVLELPLGTSHGLASDLLSRLPFRAKLGYFWGGGGLRPTFDYDLGLPSQ